MRTASVIAMVAVGMAISAVATRTYDRVQESQFQAEHSEVAVVYNDCDIGSRVVVYNPDTERKFELIGGCREANVVMSAFEAGLA